MIGLFLGGKNLPLEILKKIKKKKKNLMLIKCVTQLLLKIKN